MFLKSMSALYSDLVTSTIFTCHKTNASKYSFIYVLMLNFNLYLTLLRPRSRYDIIPWFKLTVILDFEWNEETDRYVHLAVIHTYIYTSEISSYWYFTKAIFLNTNHFFHNLGKSNKNWTKNDVYHINLYIIIYKTVKSNLAI